MPKTAEPKPRFFTGVLGKNGRNGPEQEILTVTPELAMQWLNRNRRNRRISKRTVARYITDMKAGRWRLTGQPIAFDWNGDLLDGQHRLYACVDAGVPFETAVVRGIDPATFVAYDRGKTRSGGDSLEMLGHKSGNILGAAATRLQRHMRGVQWDSTGPEGYVSIEDQVSTVEEYPQLVRSVHLADRLRSGKKRLAPPSLVGFLHFLFTERDDQLANWFFESLSTGSGLASTDATLHLRNRLLQNIADKAKLPEKEIAALFIKAWNAHRQHKAVRTLRWRNTGDNPEVFPEIV